MRLTRPTLKMEDAYRDFAEEWAEAGEELVPYAARLLDRTYAQWLDCTYRRETEAPAGYVTDHTYFWMDEGGPVLGALNLRHTLNDELLHTGGHIGYGVRPSARRQGHAGAMLAAALPLARALGLSRVLVTCDRQNTASARTIEKNGGVLENEVPNGAHIIRRYWIAL